MEKRTFLDKISQILGEYFEVEDVALEGHYKEIEHDEPSYCSLKEQWTQDIISGDESILETFLKMRNPQKKEKLEYLFKDNVELARWLVATKNNELYLKLPIEIWEMVDELVKPT